MTSPSLVDRCVATGLVLALAGLFSGLSLDTPLGSLKPFDILILIIAPPCLIFTKTRNVRISTGLLLMFLFYLVCTVPIFFFNELLYSIKRSIQIVILLSFGIVLLNVNPSALNRRHYHLALAVMACIVAFNVSWHIANGYITDWKRLGDPKSLFVFLPACVGVGIALGAIPKNILTLGVWLLLFLLIVMSGERKALPTFFVISIAVFLDLRNIHLFVLILVGGLSGLVAGDIILDGYISRRIDSITAESDARNDPLYILQGGIPASVSDAQRKVGTQVAKQLFSENPVFGAGMDACVTYSVTHFANYPKFIHGVAHNEFLRILAEQGVFGMFLMMIPLVRLLVCSALDGLKFYVTYQSIFYFRVIAILLMPIFAYMWSEGSGTEMFALVMLTALLPDILPALAVRSAHAARARSAGASRRHADLSFGRAVAVN
jgi:hypothetical protein